MKYMFVITFLLCSCIPNDPYDAYKRDVKDCDDLNPLYGRLYVVNKGPYKGIIMKAVEFSTFNVGLVILKGTDKTVRNFKCRDLDEILKK